METVCWLLYALVPALLIFSFFPSSSLIATVNGLSMDGAIAAFLLIWRYGMKKSLEAANVDDPQGEVRTLKDEVQFFLARTRGRMTLKQLGELAGGKHHNAVSIAIRRFSAHLQKDKVLRRKVSLVEMALSEPDRLSSASQCNV